MSNKRFLSEKDTVNLKRYINENDNLLSNKTDKVNEDLTKKLDDTKKELNQEITDTKTELSDKITNTESTLTNKINLLETKVNENEQDAESKISELDKRLTQAEDDIELNAIYTENKDEKARALVTVGGIEQKTNLGNNMTVKEVLKAMLQPYKAPTFISSSMSNKNIEKGNPDVDSVTYSFTAEYWSDLITNYKVTVAGQKMVDKNVAPSDINDNYQLVVSSQTISTIRDGKNLLAQSTADKDDEISYYITITDGKKDVNAGTWYTRYTRPYYYGVYKDIDTFNFSEAISSKCNKVKSKVTGNMSVSYTGNNTDLQYSVIIFPTNYAPNKQVRAIDPNNFTQQWMQIKNPDNADGYFTNVKNGITLKYYVFKSASAKFGNITYRITAS